MVHSNSMTEVISHVYYISKSRMLLDFDLDLAWRNRYMT